MRLAGFALVCCLLALPASAQTPAIVNPERVEFDPNGAYAEPVTSTSGLTRYVLKVITTGTPTATVKVYDAGKPPVSTTGCTALVAPATTCVIVTGLGPVFQTLPEGSYRAVIEAEGPGGVSVSAPTDPFTVAKPKPPAAPGKPVWKP